MGWKKAHSIRFFEVVLEKHCAIAHFPTLSASSGEVVVPIDLEGKLCKGIGFRVLRAGTWDKVAIEQEIATTRLVFKERGSTELVECLNFLHGFFASPFNIVLINFV